VAHDPSGIAQGVTPVGRPSVPSHPLPSSQLAKHEDDEEFVLTVTEETEGAPALSFPPPPQDTGSHEALGYSLCKKNTWHLRM